MLNNGTINTSTSFVLLMGAIESTNDHHRDTENTEDAQRLILESKDFSMDAFL
jgi:hypothetical protein